MDNSSTPGVFYQIPVRFRRLENMHIFFWLIKDLCWCIVYRPLGLAMIVPTLSIALMIAWNNRKVLSELCHNAAIILWITANSYWMISEFFGFDEQVFYNGITYKLLAVIPFSIGLFFLIYYYGYVVMFSDSKGGTNLKSD